MDKYTIIVEERGTGKVVKKAVFYDEKAVNRYADSMLDAGYAVTLRCSMAPQKRKKR